MQKSDLTTYIKKYFLNSNTDKVIWEIKEGRLYVNCNAAGVFVSIDAEVSELSDVKFGVSDTNILLTRLSALEGDVQLNFKHDSTGNPVQLVATDGKLTVTTTLAQVSYIESLYKGKKNTRAEINAGLPVNYTARLEITKDLTTQVNRIKKAIPDSSILQLDVVNGELEIVGSNFSGGSEGSTREEVKFTYPITISTEKDVLPFEQCTFNLDLVQSIFAANTDYRNAEIRFYFVESPIGIVCAADFIFTAEDCESTYLVKSLINNN